MDFESLKRAVARLTSTSILTQEQTEKLERRIAEATQAVQAFSVVVNDMVDSAAYRLEEFNKQNGAVATEDAPVPSRTSMISYLYDYDVKRGLVDTPFNDYLLEFEDLEDWAIRGTYKAVRALEDE